MVESTGMGIFMLQFLALNELEQKYGPGVAAVIIFGVCILGFAILMTVIIILDRIAYKRRQIRRQHWGELHGYRLCDPLPDGLVPRYAPNEVSQHTLATYPHVWFLQQPSAHAFNILAGRENSEEIRVFDYRYTTGSGRSTAEHKYSIVAIQLPQELPALIFRKRVVSDRFANKVGQDLLTAFDQFDERFIVQWDVDGVLQRRLDDAVIEQLSNNLAREYFVSGWQCVVVAHNHLKDKHYEQLLSEALWFSQWLLGRSVSPPGNLDEFSPLEPGV